MMRTLKAILPLLLAVALGGTLASPVNGQDAPPHAAPDALSLKGAIDLALAHNPELRASGAMADAAAGRADQARRWSNPELELNSEDWPVSDGGGFSDAKQTIGVVQTLPFPGKKSLDTRIGAAGVKLSEAELALRRTQLVRDVKTSFFSVLASEQLVEVSAQLVAVAELSVATARKRAEVGATPYQEQLRAEIQLEQARAELGSFHRDLATARQSLATLLGRPDMKGARLSGALAEEPDPALMGDAARERLADHPSLSIAQSNLDRAQLAHRRAGLDPYPDIRVGVSGGRIGETGQSIVQLGFSVPLPILDRGAGKQREARANVHVAEAELLSAQQRLQSDWANALERYRSAVEQVKSYRDRILPKAGEALRLVQTGFEQGKFNFIDLLDTQRTTVETRLAYQGRLLDMNVTQAELEALADSADRPQAPRNRLINEHRERP